MMQTKEEMIKSILSDVEEFLEEGRTHLEITIKPNGQSRITAKA